MRKPVHALMMLTLISQPALASRTACIFSGDTAAHYYEVEFIGYDDKKPMIVFSSTAFGSGKRITLQPGHYTLKHFSPKTQRIDLAFRNPNDCALPRSFRLVGTGDNARLDIGSSAIQGVLTCGD